MEEPVEFLVTRRSRRSTAGNRMEAALAEMALDTTVDSVDDDQDFVNDKEEEDVFGSDFESTDEEAAQEDADAGEKVVQDEEKRARKDARSKVEKATAAAHARQKVTFNPQAEASTSEPKAKDLKRRVSLGPAVNAETGEVLPVNQPNTKKKRHSQRRHTILATSAAAERLKRSEEKKAAMPKKAKIESKTYTQAELIALALDNEEGNIIDHRDYLKVEEEKRKRARVVRTTVEGPLIRWISRGEETKVVIQPPPTPTFTPGRAGFAYNTYGTMGTTLYGQTTPFTFSAGAYPHMATGGYMSGYPGATTSPSTQPMNDSAASTATLRTALAQPPSQPTTPSIQLIAQSTAQSTSQLTLQTTQATQPTTQPAIRAVQTTSQPTLQPITQLTTPLKTQPASHPLVQPSTSTVSQQGSQSATQPTYQTTSYQSTHYNPYIAQLQSTGAMPWTPPPPPAPIERIEKVTKNYVIHELAQNNGAPKPPWNETMAAMFGDDVDWSEVKVYVGKNRPLSRPKQTCPITGKEAKYLDPRTGVPYADLKAYDVLTKLLAHEYAWNPSLGCYVGQE